MTDTAIQTEVVIDGIAYVVVQRETPEIMEAKGRANLARHMRESRILAHTVVRRPKGKKLYLVYEHEMKGRPDPYYQMVFRRGF